MFAELIAKGGKGLVRGIGALVHKIRERRMRLGKGKFKNRPLPDASTRAGRLKFSAELRAKDRIYKVNENGYEVLKTSPVVPVNRSAGFGGIVDSLKALYYKYPALVQGISVVVAGWYMLTQTNLLMRKKKVSVKRRKKRVSSVRSVPVAKTKRSTAKPVMPVKYRKGCKGKKGTELGRCLQYWRKYRKGEIKLS